MTATIKAKIVLDTSEIKQLQGASIGSGGAGNQDTSSDSVKNILKSMNDNLMFIRRLTRGQLDVAQAGKLGGGLLKTIGSALTSSTGLATAGVLGMGGMTAWAANTVGEGFVDQFKDGADWDAAESLGISDDDKMKQGLDTPQESMSNIGLPKDVLAKMDEMGVLVDEATLGAEELKSNVEDSSGAFADIFTTADGMNIDMQFVQDTLTPEFKKSIQDWIDANNKAVSKVDNYASTIPSKFKKPEFSDYRDSKSDAGKLTLDMVPSLSGQLQGILDALNQDP